MLQLNYDCLVFRANRLTRRQGQRGIKIGRLAWFVKRRQKHKYVLINTGVKSSELGAAVQQHCCLTARRTRVWIHGSANHSRDRLQPSRDNQQQMALGCAMHLLFYSLVLLRRPFLKGKPNNRMGDVKEISDYKLLAQGRRRYLNVPFIICVEVKKQTLVISDASDRFDSFITSLTSKSPIKIYFLWQFSDYWSSKLLGVWVDIKQPRPFIVEKNGSFICCEKTFSVTSTSAIWNLNLDSEKTQSTVLKALQLIPNCNTATIIYSAFLF